MDEQEFRKLGHAQIDKPYVFGKSGPATFDCSGLTQFMLAAVGIHADGRSAQDQHDYFAKSANGDRVDVGDLALGDLCFYGSGPDDIHHVTIAWGGGKVLEAGLGDRTTTSPEEAAKRGAKVMISDIHRHKHLLDTYRPHGLPWQSKPAPKAMVGAAPATDADLLAVVGSSPLRHYDWPDRGVAPRSYLDGMTLCFARAVRLAAAPEGAPTGGGYDDASWKAGRRTAALASAAALGDNDHDVLSFYGDEITHAGGSLATATDRLVALFAIMIGLGMRESSGRFCVGADTPKSRGEPTTPSNAEAGLFQVSWDSIGSNQDRRSLFEAFKHRSDLRDIFAHGVACHGSDLVIHGDGEKAEFQTAMKENPLFASLYTAAFLRVRLGHWGPIKRKKAELRPEAISMLREAAAVSS